MSEKQSVPATSNDILSFIDSLPDGPRAFTTWEEYERHLQSERDSWDRDNREKELTNVGLQQPTP